MASSQIQPPCAGRVYRSIPEIEQEQEVHPLLEVKKAVTRFALPSAMTLLIIAARTLGISAQPQIGNMKPYFPQGLIISQHMGWISGRVCFGAGKVSEVQLLHITQRRWLSGWPALGRS